MTTYLIFLLNEHPIKLNQIIEFCELKLPNYNSNLGFVHLSVDKEKSFYCKNTSGSSEHSIPVLHSFVVIGLKRDSQFTLKPPFASIQSTFLTWIPYPHDTEHCISIFYFILHSIIQLFSFIHRLPVRCILLFFVNKKVLFFFKLN